MSKSKMPIYSLKKIIFYLYNILFFVTPLIFFSKTSELFEFNKIVFLYLITTFITSLWLIECIRSKKIIFRKTTLHIPILIFLITQVISTLLSSDVKTSIFGYYSRWNGGLLSIICYILLYSIYVTLADKLWTKAAIKSLFISTLIISVWAALEHFGKSPSCLILTGNFDTNCWVQDVKLRVFATLGQPNWLAAFIVALLPLTFSFITKAKGKALAGYLGLYTLFFLTLLFTKSRSALLSFGIVNIIYWGLIIITSKKETYKSWIKTLLITNLVLVVCVSLLGTPWTPSIFDLIQRNKTAIQTDASVSASQSTALETGGTESGEIRKIVWRGAINVWRQYPLFGSGVETFASSYYLGRPVEHNIVSEWNFLYNKAHNEYLNYLATTGAIGLAGYLFLILVSLLSFKKSLSNGPNYIQIALLSGYVSILITNFFGFSVVSVSLLFYLLPAFAYTQNIKEVPFKKDLFKLSLTQKGLLALTVLGGLYLTFNIVNYWRADFLYAASLKNKNEGNYEKALNNIFLAKEISSEPLYFVTEASYFTDIALFEQKNGKDTSFMSTLTTKADTNLSEAVNLASLNVKILKQIANTYDDLGEIDPSYYTNTINILTRLEKLAPTDASVYYQKGLTLAKIDDPKSLLYIKKAVELKPNYKIARRLLAFMYKNMKEFSKAYEQLNYILKYISPDDLDVQNELKTINQKLK